MGHKERYSIPTSINQSYLDHEINLSTANWTVKPIPLKVVLFYVISVLLLFWVCTQTFVKDSNWWNIVLVILWWSAATIFFGAVTKTKEMRFRSVGALIEYIPKERRKLITRTGSNPSAFYSIVGIDSVDESGQILFADGTVGQSYLVVGSASVLVFEDDKNAILDRVDSFYRKAEPNVEWIWITTKEPQRVAKQRATLERKNEQLEIRDPELFALLEEDDEILRDYVGKEFTSIHQYLIAKADGPESLRRAHQLLLAETESSSLMIRSCTMLDDEAFFEMARTLYTLNG